MCPVALDWVEGKLILDVEDRNNVQLFISFLDNINLLVRVLPVAVITSVIQEQVYDFVVFSSFSDRAKHLDKVFLSEGVVSLLHCQDTMALADSNGHCLTWLILCPVKHLEVVSDVRPSLSLEVSLLEDSFIDIDQVAS
jgi:hypothetical protein